MLPNSDSLQVSVLSLSLLEEEALGEEDLHDVNVNSPESLKEWWI